MNNHKKKYLKTLVTLLCYPLALCAMKEERKDRITIDEAYDPHALKKEIEWLQEKDETGLLRKLETFIIKIEPEALAKSSSHKSPLKQYPISIFLNSFREDMLKKTKKDTLKEIEMEQQISIEKASDMAELIFLHGKKFFWEGDASNKEKIDIINIFLHHLFINESKEPYTFFAHTHAHLMDRIKDIYSDPMEPDFIKKMIPAIHLPNIRP